MTAHIPRLEEFPELYHQSRSIIDDTIYEIPSQTRVYPFTLYNTGEVYLYNYRLTQQVWTVRDCNLFQWNDILKIVSPLGLRFTFLSPDKYRLVQFPRRTFGALPKALPDNTFQDIWDGFIVEADAIYFQSNAVTAGRYF